MKRFLIIQNYIVISDDDEDFLIEDFLNYISESSAEPCLIKKIFIFDKEKMPTKSTYQAELLAIDFWSHGGLYRECKPEEFDIMWQNAH